MAPASGSLIRLTLRIAGCRLDLFERLLGGNAVEVDDADRFAARLLAAHVHLRDVDVVAAERRADEADQARHVVVGEDEQVAVQVGVEPVRAEADQADELLAEEGSGGDVRLAAR